MAISDERESVSSISFFPREFLEMLLFFSVNPLKCDWIPPAMLSNLSYFCFWSQVVSYRGHFQDYLIKSLEANNDLKGTNAKLNAELSK